MYSRFEHASGRPVAPIAWALALLLAAPLALASGTGLVVTVGDIDVAGLPVSYCPSELGAVASPNDAVALDPRFAEAEARFAADPDLTACLALTSAAVSATRSAPGGPPSLVAALASAAHIAFSAGDPELAESVVALLVERAPAVSLDPQRHSPDVIEAVERARGPLGPLLTVNVEGAPGEEAPTSCGLDVGVQSLGLATRLPERAVAAVLHCGTERASLVGIGTGAVAVPAWRLGAAFVDGRVRVSSAARAEQLSSALLTSGVVPWALVLARAASGGIEARLHRDGRVDRLVGDPSDLAGKVDAILADESRPFAEAAAATSAGTAWWHWGLIGLGAAALVAGGVLNGLAAEQVESELNAGEDVWDDVEARTIGYWSLYGAGAALSLTGTIFAAIDAAGD
ncbi:MAG: hypothetical protein IV100_22110 [Myxococcales bacterium]|nr:hypothetical protein [Myxococcales bacterium]